MRPCGGVVREENKLTTTVHVDGVTLSAAAWANDVDDATYSGLTSPAGTNTITATGPANFAYTSGKIVRWIPAGTNTGATTINITPSGASALGAKNVFIKGAACSGGEILIDVPCQAMYDGTQFNLLGPFVANVVKVKNITRDTGVATSSVAYTGVGFKPSAVQCFAAKGLVDVESHGFYDGTTYGCTYTNYVPTTQNSTTALAILSDANGSLTTTVASFDADGITLTHTRAGTCTGTADLALLFFR